MSIIVYDLDDTLRDTSCAVEYIPDDKSKQENWVMWQREVNIEGTPIDCIVEMYHEDLEASRLNTRNVYIVTSSSFGTYEWLGDNDVLYPRVVVERGAGDNRSPVQCKKDWLIINAHDVVKWIDDSQEVCDYVRGAYPHIEVVQVLFVPGIGYETISSHAPTTPLSEFVNRPTSTKGGMMEHAIDEACELQLQLDEPKKYNATTSPLEVQVGGGHYKNLNIQPAEYCAKNNIGFLEGSVIKYATRHESKNGIEDINKAIHFLEIIKHLKYGERK